MTTPRLADVPRPSFTAFTRDPRIASQKLIDKTVGEVADRQFQVAIRGTGPMSQRELVPVTKAAADMLTGKHGTRFEQFLRGTLSVFDGYEGVSQLKGISLATSRDGFALNSAMSYTELEGSPGISPVRVSKADVADAVDALQGGRNVSKAGTVAQNLGWLNLGPAVSAEALKAVRGNPNATDWAGTYVAAVVNHEGQHGITPPTMKDLVKSKFFKMSTEEQNKLTLEEQMDSPKPINWLEEGTAETISRWPGAVAKVAKAAGLRHLPGSPKSMLPTSLDDVDFNNPILMAAMSVLAKQQAGVPLTREDYDAVDTVIAHTGMHPRSTADKMNLMGNILTGQSAYPEHEKGIRTLLQLGGVDVDSPAAFGTAMELLQGSPITRISGKLARNIIREQGLDPSVYEELRTRIRDAGPSATINPLTIAPNIKGIVEFVEQHKPAGAAEQAPPA